MFDLTSYFLQDDPDGLSWCLPLFVTVGHLHRIIIKSKDRSESGPLLQMIRNQCDKSGYDWSSTNKQRIANFIKKNTVRDAVKQTIGQSAELLVMALFSAEEDPQSSLAKVADCLHLLSSHNLISEKFLSEMFPHGKQIL